MRLLICTQAVDKNDQSLGFFHGWLIEFARLFERVHVICLKEGQHDLPVNVFVHSLGKETGVSRLKYVVRFYRYIFSFRNEYDAVFVHMNQEYVLLGWKVWFLLGKCVVLWRNHKKGSLLTRIAALLSHKVCYTSPYAYVSGYANAVRMPIGIDTNFFRPHEQQKNAMLFLGRLDAVKKPDIFLEAIKILRSENVSVPVHVYGDPTPGREGYAEEIKGRFADITNLAFFPSVPHAQTSDLYGSHSIYVNITPSGSFDKTIGEAMASGCIVVAANEVLRGIIPDNLLVDSNSAGSVAEGIRAALAMTALEREELKERSRSYVEREHSLALLARKLVGIVTA